MNSLLSKPVALHTQYNDYFAMHFVIHPPPLGAIIETQKIVYHKLPCSSGAKFHSMYRCILVSVHNLCIDDINCLVVQYLMWFIKLEISVMTLSWIGYYM